MDIKIYKSIKTPVYLQLASQLKARIITKELGDGDVLPSERDMAERLGIHRNTVTKAYKELESLDLIESRQGFGYVVKIAPKEGEKAAEVFDNKGRVNWSAMIHDDYMTNRRKFDDLWLRSYDRDVCPFATGAATAGIYEGEDLSKAFESVVEQGRRGEYFFTPYQGDMGLRRLIVKFMREKGIDVSTSEIQIFSESNQALDFMITLMLKPGDVVLTEEPLNPDIFRSFDLAGVKQITIPMDKNGIFTDNLDGLIEKYRPKLMYINSSYNDPTGTILSYERRKKLLELSYKYRMPIIEDDAASLLDYDYTGIPPLRAMDHGENVIYMYSFEMTFIPGLNVTFVVAPKQVAKSLSYLVSLRLVSLDVIPQRLLEYFLRTGLYQKSVAKMKLVNLNKRNLMYRFIENAEIDDFYAVKPMGGVYIWCHIPEHINIRKLLQLTEKRGVVFVPGYLFYPSGKQPSNYIRLCYSTPSEAEINKGMPILVDTIREML